MLSLIFAITLGAASVQIPLKGDPLPPAAVASLESLPGVADVETNGTTLTVEVAPDAEVRLRDLTRVIARHTKTTTIDADSLQIGPDLVLEMNAGRCFFCAEAPLGVTLARRKFVKNWTIVDYATKGRMRFRVDPEGDVRLGAFTGAYEDILFTSRYREGERVKTFWPSAGIAWRPDEKTARSEATASRKPLMIFPTAGT